MRETFSVDYSIGVCDGDVFVKFTVVDWNITKEWVYNISICFCAKF